MRLAPFIFLPMVTFCAHLQAAEPGPDGACCRREQRSYGIEQANPFGGPPAQRIPVTLHCLLRFEDGITEDVTLRVQGPHDVVFEEARPTAQCAPCSSQLRLRATLQLSAPEHGVELAGDAQLTQIDVDSRLEFLLQQGELFTDGVLVEGSKYVRVARGTQHHNEHVIARSAGPCLAD
jgi:hypothetical protein